MSFQAAAITGKIGLDEAPAVRSLKNVGKEAGAMKGTVEQQMGAAGASGGKAFFKGLNAEFGKKSVLGQSLKLAAGGGAIGGVALAVGKFQELAGSVEDLATAFRKGDQSASEIWGGFLRGVPILGGMVKGFDSLREAVTGEAAAMAKDAEYVKASEDSLKRQVEIVEHGKKAAMEWAEIIGKLREEGRVQAGGPGVAADVSFEDKAGALKAKYEGDLDAQIKAKKPLDDAMAKRDRLRADLDQAQKAITATGRDPNSNLMGPLRAKRDAAGDAFMVQAGIVQNLQGEYNKLTKVATDAEASFMTARGQAIDNEAARLEAEVAKNIRDNPFMLGTGAVGPVGGYTGEAAKGGGILSELIKLKKEQDKNLHEVRSQQLPSARVQAEDVMAGRVVTQGDVTKNIEVNKETAENTKKANELLQQLLNQSKQGPSATGVTVDVIGLD